MLADERRREILEALCLRRFDTMRNLAFEFGVSMRMIAVDVLRLSCRYPIYTKMGYGGGVFVEDWYELDMKYLRKSRRNW